MIKDKFGFCKLIDINVPDFEHFDYYIEQLSKLERWKNIYHLIALFKEAEDSIDDLFQFRIDKSNELINFLKSTRAFTELNDDNLIPSLPVTNNFQYSEDKLYLSCDIMMANWTVLKKYDPDFLNELGDTYAGLLKRFEFPDIFLYSKQLRQFIFGNLNPKRQTRAQRVIVQEVIDKFNHLGVKIASIKNDEVIFEFDKIEEVIPILDGIDTTKFKTKIFSVKRIEDFRLNTFLDRNGEEIYKEMSGCNGNLFYLNLKKWVLNEPIDVRDLYFRMDGRIAVWKEEGVKIEI